MQTFTYGQPKPRSWGMGKSALLLLVVGFLSLGSLVGVYYWERLSQPRTALIDRETQQIETRVRENPQDPDARLTTASVYLQKGQYDQAIEQYKQALVLREDDPLALMGIGVASMEKGKLDDALIQFNRVVELSAGSEFAQIDKRLAAAYYYLGKIYLDSNRPEDAAPQLEKARGIDKTNADYLYLSAVASQKLGDHAKAIDLFTRALTFDPAFTEAYQGLASSYKGSGDNAKATYADAMALVFSGQADSTIGKLQSVAESDPNADVLWGLGWAFETKGRKDQAIGAYKRALSMNPRHSLSTSALRRLENSR